MIISFIIKEDSQTCNDKQNAKRLLVLFIIGYSLLIIYFCCLLQIIACCSLKNQVLLKS